MADVLRVSGLGLFRGKSSRVGEGTLDLTGCGVIVGLIRNRFSACPQSSQNNGQLPQGNV